MALLIILEYKCLRRVVTFTHYLTVIAADTEDERQVAIYSRKRNQLQRCIGFYHSVSICLLVWKSELETRTSVYDNLARQSINKTDRVCLCYYLLVPCQAVTVLVAN